ncbi:hypothetical protein IG631_17138 [Alternaria alternata]|nr:hypothetical protein IG631_17138 [Alternaria alternata]
MRTDGGQVIRIIHTVRTSQNRVGERSLSGKRDAASSARHVRVAEERSFRPTLGAIARGSRFSVLWLYHRGSAFDRVKRA